MDGNGSIDLACAIALWGVLASAIVAFVFASLAWGRRGHERLVRESGLPLFGKVPMEAVYAALVPIGRGLARIGVSANAVSIASLAIAALAGCAFALGHFGVGAAVAVVATLADGVDGIVARASKTSGRFGQVLDTTIDRYVDAFLFGGIAIFVRHEAWLLALTIGALVGGFMVSYASSVLRELKASDSRAPMRRVHRVAYLLGGATLAPLTQFVLFDAAIGVRIAPVVLALGVIAVVGNVSAVHRLLTTARAPEPLPTAVTSVAVTVSAPKPKRRRAAEGSPVVTRERHP